MQLATAHDMLGTKGSVENRIILTRGANILLRQIQT